MNRPIWVLCVTLGPTLIGAWTTQAARGDRARQSRPHWSAPRQQPVRVLHHPERVFRLCFSPDGKTLATGCDEGVMRLWDASTWQIARSFGFVRRHAGPSPEHICCLAFSPDGGFLAAGGDDSDVRIWDTNR